MPAISFGADIDKIEEQDGWVFVQEGNAYVAFRFVFPAVDTINASTDKRTAVPIPYALDEDGFGLFKPEPAPYTWKESKPGEPRTLEAKEPLCRADRRGVTQAPPCHAGGVQEGRVEEPHPHETGHPFGLSPDLQGLRQGGEGALSELRHRQAGEDRRRSPEL